MPVLVLAALAVTVTPAARAQGQRLEQTRLDSAVAAANRVSTTDYYLGGIAAGIPLSYATDLGKDADARTIGLTVAGAGVAALLWRTAARPRAAEPLGNEAAYRAEVVSRRRRALVLGLLAGTAAGLFLFLPVYQGS